jgi:RHS repeat-associated protein
VNRYAYDDFGREATNSVEGMANPFRYVGKYGVQTDANDLLYMRARYYKPSIGRFINKDPIGLQGGINPYLYVGANPIRFIDPNGLLWIWDSWGEFWDWVGDMIDVILPAPVVGTSEALSELAKTCPSVREGTDLLDKPFDEIESELSNSGEDSVNDTTQAESFISESSE